MTAPSSVTAEHKDQAQKRRRAIVAVCIVIVLAILVLMLSCTSSWTYDPSAQAGYYAGKSQAEIEAELNRVVAEGEFNISVCTPISKNSDGLYDVRFENVAANRRDCIVTLSVAQTGQVMCRTGAMEPGTYIQSKELDTTGLESGTTVDCIALFETYKHEAAYDSPLERFFGSYEDTHEKTGQAAAAVKVVVS